MKYTETNFLGIVVTETFPSLLMWSGFGTFKIFLVFVDFTIYETFTLQNFNVDVSFPKKKSGVFGLISNCRTHSKRELALTVLSRYVYHYRDYLLRDHLTFLRYINVTIGGKCATDKANTNLCPHGSDCLSLYGEYPFYLAVENSVCNCSSATVVTVKYVFVYVFS